MCELLKINVNDHVEKKNGLSYLSWAWAWAEVLKVDPLATWRLAGDHYPCHFFQDGSAMVTVEVTIKGHTKACILPVMDHKNKAIKNPDAFAINTAIMRCMTKAIGMHGLGLYIYAGEDLPEADDSLEQTLKDSIEAAKSKKLNVGVIKPTVGAGNGIPDERKSELDDIALHLIDCHRAGKDLDAVRVWYAADSFSDNDERVYVWSRLATESKLRSTIKANKPAEAAQA